MSNYAYFKTYRPVNFDDFDGVGARLIGGSALLYSWCSLTLWDGPAYVGKGLAWARMSGWGVATPNIGVDHGIATVMYGDGSPIGTPETVIELTIPPFPEEISVHVQITMKDDSFVVILQGDVLFDSDKFDIKPEAVQPLTPAAAVIKSARRLGAKILINGHTDSVGTDDYNMTLSKRRANAVAQWFVTRKYFADSDFKPQGFGKTAPVAPNTDALGRAKNRRVEIYVLNPITFRTCSGRVAKRKHWWWDDGTQRPNRKNSWPRLMPRSPMLVCGCASLSACFPYCRISNAKCLMFFESTL